MRWLASARRARASPLLCHGSVQRLDTNSLQCFCETQEVMCPRYGSELLCQRGTRIPIRLRSAICKGDPPFRRAIRRNGLHRANPQTQPPHRRPVKSRCRAMLASLYEEDREVYCGRVGIPRTVHW